MKRIVVSFLVLFCLFLAGAQANKTSVEIKAPAEIKAGTEVTITVMVSHSANSKGHHTDWVTLKINGKEVKRWEYNKESLPPDSSFTLEFKYVASEALTVEAQGHCNMHGSMGKKAATIKTTN
jgi:desulfoferrodoxin (superoxide reductase-like protein)